MLDVEMKKRHLRAMADYRRELCQKPELRNLFLELTVRCNERCLHCGSSCGEVTAKELPAEVYKRLLDEVKADFGTERKMLCITGGEPLLRKEFFEIMGYANALGFSWGMTSNGTLIDRETARKLRETGMKTISVSIDGLEATHDAFRRTQNGWRRAMEGINNLLAEGGFKHVQVTTVVTHQNIGELDELFEIFDKMDIDSWRVIGIEPIGRALRYPELLLTDDDQRRMIEFIRNKRMAGEPVCYGCSHYLGLEYEREVRDWYFLCTAGLQTASITAEGDIIACLDIERRPEFVQGNILRDRFSDVWRGKFKVFRREHWNDSQKCRECEHKDFCRADAYHSLNHTTGDPMVCCKGVLF